MYMYITYIVYVHNNTNIHNIHIHTVFIQDTVHTKSVYIIYIHVYNFYYVPVRIYMHSDRAPVYNNIICV